VSRLPQPLSVTGRVIHDPVTRSVSTKPAEAGLGSLIWRQGHEALMQGVGSIGGPRPVYARVGNKEISRGEPVRDQWLRFALDDADYRMLAREGVHAILTVDRQVDTATGSKAGQLDWW